MSEISQLLTDSQSASILTSRELVNTNAPLLDENNQVFTFKLDDTTVSILLSKPKHRLIPSTANQLAEVYRNIYRNIKRAITDKLTGLMNRECMNEKMHRILLGAKRSDRRNPEVPRVLVVFDIDHFKRVNDTFGHVYGDEVILRVAQQAEATFRVEDWVFRYGGEEFVAVLHDIDLATAGKVVERLRNDISSIKFDTVGQITISAGYSILDYDKLLTDNIDRADKALYYAKENGRNRAFSYQTLIEQGLIAPESEPDSDIELF